MRGVAKGLCLRQFTVSSLIILYRSYALHVYMLVNFGERGEICIVCLPRCFLRRFLLEFKSLLQSLSCKVTTCYAGFRLTCRLPHCRFHDDISSTAQAPLAAEGWPSGKQRQANRSITLPLCPPRQIADSWILFNSGAIAARWKAKAALPPRAATLKHQAMPSGVAAKRRAAS